MVVSLDDTQFAEVRRRITVSSRDILEDWLGERPNGRRLASAENTFIVLVVGIVHKCSEKGSAYTGGQQSLPEITRLLTG